ncbi:MAG: dTMP kinase [Peptococcaceae bacterium]|nr:dTMP kinase [Peptococcaceae bacterium]
MSGILIVFEGIDGVGKSTQLELLYYKLKTRGLEVCRTREPGGTPLGEAVRRILLDPAYKGMAPQSEVFLYVSARAQCVAEVIRPALQQGAVVLCDRFTDSTLAYQGYGRGLELQALRKVNELATGGIIPDLTVLLDMPVEEALARVRRGGTLDRLEQETCDFYRAVRNGYLALAGQQPERYLVLPASLGKEDLAALIWSRVEVICRALQ